MTQDKPNIVLVTVDALRRDFVGIYGEKDVSTPIMDELAKEGTYLDRTVSTGPYTAASFAGIFFSRLVPNSVRDTYCVKGESVATALQERGYTTAAFHSNPYLNSVYGYDQGFETFREFTGETMELREETKKLKKWVNKSKTLGTLVRIPYYYYTQFCGIRPFLDGQEINDTVSSWIDTAEEPFFTWVHYMDTHHPYMPDDRNYSLLTQTHVLRKLRQQTSLTDEEKEIAKALYKRKVEDVDKYIGSLINSLKQAGNWENTVLIITADHGEEFGEHGRFLHTENLYDELTSVPFILNKKVDAEESLYTLLNLKQFIIDALNHGKPDISILQTDTAYSTSKNSEGAVLASERTQIDKYIVKEGGQNEYYDLERDPDETDNCIEENEKDGREQRIWDQVERPDGEPVEKDEEVKRRLEDLGYG